MLASAHVLRIGHETEAGDPLMAAVRQRGGETACALCLGSWRRPLAAGRQTGAKLTVFLPVFVPMRGGRNGQDGDSAILARQGLLNGSEQHPSVEGLAQQRVEILHQL